MPNIHQTKPQRSTVVKKKRYQDYRDALRNDFNGSCGYCDDGDDRIDRTYFHIDHFAPKSLFKHLETEYSNLVYSCRICNVRKSNHWVGNDASVHNDGSRGLIDPCSAEYDNHLERTKNGQIRGLSDLGNYVVKRLNLNLARHELLWRARRARELRQQVQELIAQCRTTSLRKRDEYIELLETFEKLTDTIDRYELRAYNDTT